MLRMLRIFLYSAPLLFIVACTPRPTPPKNTPSEKGLPLARAGEKVIFEFELKDRIEKIEEKYPRNYSTFLQKKDLLQEMLHLELLYKKALESGLSDSYEFKARLVDLYIQELSKKARDSLTEKQVKDIYEKYPQEFDQVSARHILFQIHPKMKEAEIEARKKQLIEIREYLLKNPDDFPAQAKKHSDDGTRTQGGELGFFTRKMMVPPFSNTAFSLKTIGEISPVVRTEFGFHVIQLTGDRRGYEIHKDRIKDRLIANTQRDRLNTELADLKKNKKFEIYEENLKKISPLPEIINKEVEIKPKNKEKK